MPKSQIAPISSMCFTTNLHTVSNAYFPVHAPAVYEVYISFLPHYKGLDRSLWLQEAENFWTIQHIKVVRVSALSTIHLHHTRKYSRYSFLFQAESTQRPRCEKSHWNRRPSGWWRSVSTNCGNTYRHMKCAVPTVIVWSQTAAKHNRNTCGVWDAPHFSATFVPGFSPWTSGFNYMGFEADEVAVRISFWPITSVVPCQLSINHCYIIHSSVIKGMGTGFVTGGNSAATGPSRHEGMTIRWKQPTNSSWNTLRLSNNFSFSIFRDITQLCLYPTSSMTVGEVWMT